jgi:hypothetical protein
VDFEHDDCARFVNGNEKRLANLKEAIAVYDRAGFGPGDHGSREWFGGKDAAVGMKSEMKAAQDFQWINPGLESTFFVSEERGTPSDCGDELAFSYGT